MDGGGGFHGYRRLQQTSSDINMRLPEMNNPTDINDDNNMSSECTVREQDRFMPIANVIRIMRKTLPPHAKISDDAKETIQECVSEFISFVTSEANDRCQKEQRKTITAEDVLWAMTKLGFDDYVDPLTFYLHRFREMEGDRGAIRGDVGPMMMKRGGEFGPMGGFPGFGPECYMGHNQVQHQHGFFGTGGGDNNVGSSHGGGVHGVDQTPPAHGHQFK